MADVRAEGTAQFGGRARGGSGRAEACAEVETLRNGAWMLMRRSSGGGLTVGIVHWALPPTIGGVESHLADYIRLLHGQNVKVVAFTGGRATREVRKYAKVKHHPLLHLAGGGTAPKDGPEHVEELSRWLLKKVDKYDVDIIHGHNLHHFSSVPASAINHVHKILGTPRQHTFHNYWRDAKCADLVEGWEGRWANSEFVAQKCAEKYPGNAPQYRYLGVDADRFACWREPFAGRDPRALSPGNAPVILQPARLLPWKGPEYSIRMLSKLRKAGYSARLVLTDTPSLIDWDGERQKLRDELTALVKELDLVDWVTFNSRAHYKDMPRLYNDADIVINPSRSEPLGLVPLEAMASSRPVVATYSGGMRETVTRKTGTLVNDDSNIVHELTKAVRDYLDAPNRAVHVGREGRAHVVKKFQMTAYVEDMLHEYSTARKAIASHAASGMASASTAQPVSPDSAVPVTV